MSQIQTNEKTKNYFLSVLKHTILYLKKLSITRPLFSLPMMKLTVFLILMLLDLLYNPTHEVIDILNIILTFIAFIISAIFGFFVGISFLKSPKGKNVFFILEPLITISFSIGVLIYLFFIPIENTPFAYQIWMLITRITL